MDNTIKDQLFFNPAKKYYKINSTLLKFSNNYSELIEKTLKIAKSFEIKVVAWLNCLKHPSILPIFPEWAQITYNGIKSRSFLCPNNIEVQNYVSGLLKNLIKEYNIDGIELYNARFPNPYREGYGCFCDSCQKEAINPRAFEDLKERELIEEQEKKINIKAIQKYFSNKKNLLISETLNRDLVFKTWNRFRYNSITRFVGKLLVAARIINQTIKLGTDVWPISISEIIGHNYADLATYQDLIYQNLFIKSENNFQKLPNIMKEINELKKLIKKGRGLKKFFTCIDINQHLEKNELQKIIKNLNDMKLRGLVFFYYNKENRDKLDLITKQIDNT